MTFLDRIQGIVSNIFIFQLLIFVPFVFLVYVCGRRESVYTEKIT